jgi:hypothetical protein
VKSDRRIPKLTRLNDGCVFPFPEREAFDLAASRSFFGLANQNLVPSVRGTYTFETDVIPNRSALGKHSHEYHRREPERRFEQ